MKIHISKFSIFIISVLTFAIGVYAVIVYISPLDVSSQNEKVYLHIQLASTPGEPEGYVRVSDMKPNSVGYFMYPSSYNFSDPANAYQRFMLIRLPSWLGGDRDDVSSYRAYSMLDVESHCLVKYWPQQGRQNIEDPCHDEQYRTIDGASYFFGIKIMTKPVENALPKLDLGVDDDGYIYVKPPTWQADKNGLIGDGRHLTKEEELESSRQMLQDYQDYFKPGINMPLQLNSNTFLVDILPDNDYTQFQYTTDKETLIIPRITVQSCNCTGTLSDENLNGYHDKNMQAWKVGNGLVYVHPQYDGQGVIHYYFFDFFEKGYKLRFGYTPFDEGMRILLDNFFNGTAMSDIYQIPSNSSQG